VAELLGVPAPVTVAGRRGCFPTPTAGAVGGVTGGLLMVRLCGKLGSRVCGLLGSVCGSVGLAVLVVALAALATRHAYAEDPIENCVCPPDISPEECLALCAQARNCPNAAGCNSGCHDPACWQAGCTNVSGCNCDNNNYHPLCSANCKCKKPYENANFCQCGNK
jgi:uncharacterized membrane protein YeaQ/YmgE (transglycosylase-associated protein family)